MLERAGGVDISIHMRFSFKFFVGQPPRDPYHFHSVLNPFGTQAIGMGRFVSQGELVVGSLKMANRGMQINWFYRIATHKMDTVEILAEFEEALTMRAGTRDLTAHLQVPIVWW